MNDACIQQFMTVKAFRY